MPTNCFYPLSHAELAREVDRLIESGAATVQRSRGNRAHSLIMSHRDGRNAIVEVWRRDEKIATFTVDARTKNVKRIELVNGSSNAATKRHIVEVKCILSELFAGWRMALISDCILDAFGQRIVITNGRNGAFTVQVGDGAGARSYRVGVTGKRTPGA